MVDLDICRDHGSAQRLQSRQHILGHGHRIRPGPLRHGNRYRRMKAFAIGEANVLGGFFGAIGNFRYVANEDGLVVAHARHHVPDILGCGQELPGFKKILLVPRGELTGGQAPVRCAQRPNDLERR